MYSSGNQLFILGACCREDSIDMMAAKRHNSGHLDFGAHGRTGSGVVGPRLEHYDSGRRADKFAVQEGALPLSNTEVQKKTGKYF